MFFNLTLFQIFVGWHGITSSMLSEDDRPLTMILGFDLGKFIFILPIYLFSSFLPIPPPMRLPSFIH
jgi:hypothetical protein